MWNVQKFNYGKGDFEPFYWNLSDIGCFVDSELGNDTTGDGTSTTPYKTLTKVKTLPIWDNGLRIMMNGVFEENVTIDKDIHLIGVGGYNGRAVISSGGGNNRIRVISVCNPTFDNLYFHNYSERFIEITPLVGVDIKMSNCVVNTAEIFIVNHLLPTSHLVFLTMYYNLFVSAYLNITGNYGTDYYGSNNTFYLCTRAPHILDKLRIKNSWVNNAAFAGLPGGIFNVLNTDARYFTDNTETVIHPIVHNPLKNLFSISPTFYAWDKTTQQYTTVHPLLEKGTYNPYLKRNNHIGCGNVGFGYTALNDELNDDEDATYTNLEKDNGDIFRTDDAENGILESGIIDFGVVRSGIILSASHVFQSGVSYVEKRLQYTEDFGVPQRFDFLVKYADTLDGGVITRDYKPYEYGKVMTYSKNGATVYSNAQDDFNPLAALNVSGRYFQIKIKFRTV